ncbi:MAG: hypothetical protein FJW19_04485 [Actinobacteria bacterium]|nr:hypothetical protein [Actinomycetota bacterium]
MSTFSTTEAQTPPGLLHVGRVTRLHGVKGGVHVSFFTDRPERTCAGARLFINNEWLTVTGARLQAKSKGAAPGQSATWLMHFAGVDDRDAAERLNQSNIFGEPIPDDSRMWVHELIGSQVEDVAGVKHGKCVAVVDNPAHALLELESGALVPIVFVVGRDTGVITINPPEGLFDLKDVEP